jgi:hypothetical protein
MIEISSPIFSNYTVLLIDRIYKILPLFEEHNDGLFRYIQSLIYELNGMFYVIESLQTNAEYLSLVATLESLSDDSMFFENSKEPIKREVFRCIDIVKRIDKSSTINSSGGGGGIRPIPIKTTDGGGTK